MRFLRVLLAVAAAVAAVGLLGLLYVVMAFPDVGPAQELRVAATPERIERGRYLAESVSLCIDCHSERDFRYLAGPLKEGTWGQGGERFDRSVGVPGVLHAPNLTPAALGTWTDGELLRAFTAGVTRDGRALFPLMPYPAYGRMARPDAEAIIAYLRTLAPIERQVPAQALDVPMNLIVRLIPRPSAPSPVPDPADEVAYGRYMATIAACGECHTPIEAGEPDSAMAFAGGHAFQMPWGTSRAANITPDPETGIGGWTREQFLARFAAYRGARELVSAGGFNTIMPWTQLAGMTETDLGAIYAYLRTVPPVRNSVVRFSPP